MTSLFVELKRLNACVKHTAHYINEETEFSEKKINEAALKLLFHLDKLETLKLKAPDVFKEKEMQLVVDMGLILNKAQRQLIKAAFADFFSCH